MDYYDSDCGISRKDLLEMELERIRNELDGEYGSLQSPDCTWEEYCSDENVWNRYYGELAVEDMADTMGLTVEEFYNQL